MTENGDVKVRSERYDAYYDPDTGDWYEVVCGDPECEYCKDRPDNAKGGDAS